MASARKKQDEKNLKTLRELVSLPHNKHCFDCNQRGPTYVNVTIGSFVCTKCSGILRGLTPPHRVKSISMATFTSEEVELVQTRGNDHCRRTWLGLYEGKPLPEARDEQQIHDLMIDKYERRRYYMELTPAVRGNGALPLTKPQAAAAPEPKVLRINGVSNENRRNSSRISSNTVSRPVGRSVDFVANFESADIFNAVNNNLTSQPSFANFDNNPVFSSTNPFVLPNAPTYLQDHHTNPNDWVDFDSGNSNIEYSMSMLSNVNQQTTTASIPPAPPEDRYAALKDLDNALKIQPALDWNSGSSSGSLYSSPTPAGSVYSSPSPQSMYGSPSQGQFGSLFPSHETITATNPFNLGTSQSQMWTNGNSNGVCNGSNPNPFRASDALKVNGINQSFQQTLFSTPINGSTWTPNPFKVASSNGHSNNPFL